MCGLNRVDNHFSLLYTEINDILFIVYLASLSGLRLVTVEWKSGPHNVVLPLEAIVASGSSHMSPRFRPLKWMTAEDRLPRQTSSPTASALTLELGTALVSFPTLLFS